MSQRFVLVGETIVFQDASELSGAILTLHVNDEVIRFRKMRPYNDLQTDFYQIVSAAAQQAASQEYLYEGWHFVEYSGKQGWIAGAAALQAQGSTPFYPAPMHSRQRHLQVQVVHTDVSDFQYHATLSLTSHRETWTETKRGFLWQLTRPDTGQATASAVCPYCGKSFAATIYSIEQMEREAAKQVMRYKRRKTVAWIAALLLLLGAVAACLLLKDAMKIAALLWVVIGLFICLVAGRSKGYLIDEGPLGGKISIPLTHTHPRPELHRIEHVSSHS